MSNEFNWNKKARPELTLSMMQAIIELIEQCEPDVSSELSEVKAKYKFVLLQEDAGILKGSGIKVDRPPRKNSMAGLGFVTGNANTAAQNQQTPEEIEAKFEDIFTKVQAAEAAANAILESGGKLPLLDNLLLDPAFNFKKD